MTTTKGTIISAAGGTVVALGLLLGSRAAVGAPPVPAARAAQSAPCNHSFTQADYEHCTAVCDSEHGDRVRSLPNAEFDCARARDMAVADLHTDQCHSQCDSNHNPDIFDEGACHSACDRQADERIRACGGSDGCVGWADGDGRRGCHAGCSGRRNQIVSDRRGCHDGCTGAANAVQDRFNSCVAAVAGRRIASEQTQNGCRLACGERRNAAARAYEACRPPSRPTQYSICTCDNGNGTTREVPVVRGTACNSVCPRPVGAPYGVTVVPQPTVPRPTTTQPAPAIDQPHVQHPTVRR